jgi:hypothetical protein
MADTSGSEAAKRTPPAFSFTTFCNFLESFKPDTIPSHIDRSVMGSMSGGNQAYLLGALRFFGLIDEHNVPTPVFVEFIHADKEGREKLWANMIRSRYGFLLEAVNIERTTTNIVQDKFRDQGINGDTIRKAITFFLHAAKAANMKISPHVKAPRPMSNPRATRNGGAKKDANSTTGSVEAHTPQPPAPPARETERTPYEILIDILNANMTDEEQNAVWVLIRYLKNKEAQGE